MSSPSKDNVNVRIEITVDGEKPNDSNYGLVLYALAGTAASVAKKIGATSPYTVANLIRDNVLLIWENAPAYPDETPREADNQSCEH